MTQVAVAKKRQSGFADNPDYRVDFEPCPKRIRAVLGGETLIDSTCAWLMRETGHAPVYYFPRDDLRMDRLRRTDHRSFCPYKGEASYWTLSVGVHDAENAAWSYEDPFPEVAPIKDYVGFYWYRLDAWYEEDEEVFGHARDPYVRVDVLKSSRPVRVKLAGVTLAETARARFVFETGLPTRFYIPPEDVRMDLLEPSATRSLCPYKGRAVYWSARVGGADIGNAAWSYPEPLPECAAIAGHICFLPDRVDEVTVDGKPAA